jgi:hypothetical protein
VAIDLEALRSHVGLGPSDSDLQTALDAALEALAERYGTDESEVTEYLQPFGQWVRLGRRASSITSVLEGGTTVSDDDYSLWPGGRFLRRLDADGDPQAWSGMVEVAYEPFSEAASRDRVTLALCDLDLARRFGVTSITNGPWSESYGDAAGADYAATREAILGSLRPAYSWTR